MYMFWKAGGSPGVFGSECSAKVGGMWDAGFWVLGLLCREFVRGR